MRKETNSPLSETAEVPITSVHMNNSEDEQSPTSETQVPTDSVSVDITEMNSHLLKQLRFLQPLFK